MALSRPLAGRFLCYVCFVLHPAFQMPLTGCEPWFAVMPSVFYSFWILLFSQSDISVLSIFWILFCSEFLNAAMKRIIQKTVPEINRNSLCRNFVLKLKFLNTTNQLSKNWIIQMVPKERFKFFQRARISLICFLCLFLPNFLKGF